MTQYIFRGNLSAARFPLVSTFEGRSIIIPQYDQNFQKLANFSGGDTDRDIGIPQIFYCQDVMPTSEGFQSVGYETVVSPIIPAQTDFDQAFVVRDVDENKGLFAPASGKNYMFNANLNVWNSVNPIAPGTFTDTTLVTVANLRGHTYQFYQQNGCYEYNFTTNLIAAVALGGLTVANIMGICAAVAYLIAWDSSNTVYWSSTITATDFTPSLSTGAGSEIPNDIKGDIVVCLPIPNGFVIYTTKNAVLASYTGNIRLPWLFKEIPGSAGVENPGAVTWESNTGFHYAWTTAGLLKVEKTGASPELPEITDFLAARIFEDYDAASGLLIQQYLGANLYVKLTLLGTRYLIISYGITRNLYTHALIYDIGLKRFGKVKITHVDCFDWPAPNLFGVHTYDSLSPRTYDDLAGTTYDGLSLQQITFTKPKRNIAFLQQDGTVKVLQFDLGVYNDNAVLFIGKFQLVRTRSITAINVEVENVDLANSNFDLTILATFDGKNFAASLAPPLVRRTENVLLYGGKITGLNHTLRFNGAFNLVSLLLTVISNGDR